MGSLYPMEKYGISTSDQVKDVKESFLVQLAEYAVLNQIVDKPAFAWWIKKELKKIYRIISKTASKYWQNTHKYGLRIPHSVKKAIEIKKEMGTHYGGMSYYRRWSMRSKHMRVTKNN